MDKVKNQHYVPRSYLKYFSDEKGKIWVYDKQLDKKFASNIVGVASERYFYDVPFDKILESLSRIDSIQDEDKEELERILEEANYSSSEEAKQSIEQSVEKFFSEKVEGNFKQLLDNIRSRYVMMSSPLYNQALSDEERLHLSVLLGFQIVRSKEFRESYFETKQVMTQSIVDSVASSFDKNYEKGSIGYAQAYESKPLEHASIIYSDFPFQLAEALSSHYWMVGVNNTSVPFYTSDNPIVKNGHQEDMFGQVEFGYASPGIEIAIPISSKLILILAEKSVHSYFSSLDKQYIPLNDTENIIYYNSLQVFQSNRQVYCHDNNFNLVEEMKRNEGSLSERKVKIKEVNVSDIKQK